MTESLRDRLRGLIWQTILGGELLSDHVSDIADALLASEEWQAREAVVMFAGNVTARIDAQAWEYVTRDNERLREALARLAAVRGE